MKMAVLEDAYRFVIKDVPRPVPNDQFPFLVKVHCCSICGSDVHRYKFPPNPTDFPNVLFIDKILGYPSLYVLGHQFSGDLVEVAANVKGWEPGERVVGVGSQAFAEYALAKRVIKLPQEITYEQGAFVEPLAVALSLVVRSRINIGDVVVVFGAGPIGLFTMQCAKLMGASKVYVVDVLEMRLQKAKELGADSTINAREESVIDRIKDLTGDKGPDVVFECAGKEQTLNHMIDILPKRGKGIIVAIYDDPVKVNFNRIVMKNLDISGVFVSYDEPIFAPERWLSRHDIFEIAIEFIRTGKVKVDPIITSIMPLEKINEAFTRLIQGQELGVILKP